MCISRLHPQGKEMKLLAWAALFSARLGRMTAAICVSGITCLVNMLIHWASSLGHLSQDHWGPFGTEQVNTETKEAIHLQREQPYLNQQLVHVNNHVLFDWSNAGEQGDIWRRAEILLVSAVNYQVVIEGLSGPGYQGDIALDDISFTPNCRPDTTATISPIPPSGTPPPGCNSGQYRYLCCKSGQYYRYLCCKSGQISLQRKIRNISFSIFHFFLI